jgi:DNA-binding XRE family transcriptional regulator
MPNGFALVNVHVDSSFSRWEAPEARFDEEEIRPLRVGFPTRLESSAPGATAPGGPTRAGAKYVPRYPTQSNLYYMVSPGQTDIGAALRILRARAELTQEELAARADITAPYLSRVEGGWRDIRWSTLKRLLGALDADLPQLQDAIDHADGEDQQES